MNADDAPCSMDPSCHFWISKKSLPWQVYFSNPLPLAVQAHLVGTPTAPKVSFMSFPAEPGGCFAKHTVGDGWSTDLLPVYEDALLTMRQQVREHVFDTVLRHVLFSHNGMHVNCVRDGLYC